MKIPTPMLPLLFILAPLASADPLAEDAVHPGDTLNTVQEIRSIQVPYFDNGKFAGYQDVPVAADEHTKPEDSPERATASATDPEKGE